MKVILINRKSKHFYMKRTLNIILSGLLVLFCLGYAAMKKNEIEKIPYKIIDPYISSNGKKILETGDNYFKIFWMDRSIKTFHLDISPPFKKNDIVAFKLKKKADRYTIEEYHIWESQSKWYKKAFLSAIPLFIVFLLLLKSFRFDFKQFMFIERRGKNA